MFLVVGLGNPGPKYQDTRHNLGWMVVKQAAARWGITLRQQGEALQSHGKVGDHPVTLVLPLAWMNQTGLVVRSLFDSHLANSPSLIVIYDDLDLPLGVTRIKTRGGPGGHNGLRSIISCLGTEEFSRVKIGIGRPDIHEDPAHFVLSPFSADEWATVEKAIHQSTDVLECLITEGASKAMNRYHSTLPSEKSEESDESEG